MAQSHREDRGVVMQVAGDPEWSEWVGHRPQGKMGMGDRGEAGTDREELMGSAVAGAQILEPECRQENGGEGRGCQIAVMGEDMEDEGGEEVAIEL
jgi:hypothetical protein